MNDQITARSASAQGERRQITALFMDIAGFSKIASKADPEDLQQWLEAFYTQAKDIVEAHDGTVTEYLGDGIVALFGLDHADELAASKAVNASMTALREIDAGRNLGIVTTLRIGVATGEAAVRPQSEYNSRPRAIGMVTTLAQRIQERAAPGTVMISDSTRALLRGDIPTEEFANEDLKGFAEAQTLFRPLSEPAEETAPKTAFVGRTGVLQRIAKKPGPVLLVGPAGIGKTALAQHLARHAVAATTFSADGVHLRASYQPFTRWLLRETGSALPDFTELSKRFSALPENSQQALALILGLPEGQQLLTKLSNTALKALIEESLWMAIRVTQTQGMLIFEDLHWLDSASFGVLTHIIESGASSHYQILMTTREDTKISKFLGSLPIKTIPLEPMSDTEATSLLNAVSQGKATANERAAVIPRAGGIPLFIEQIYKRDAARTGSRRDVPSTLKDLLAQQIEATGPGKLVLQCAAIIGRRFDLEMLNVIASENGPVAPHLDAACNQGVIKRISDTEWAFSHALLQQAAYESMLRPTRIDYHARIAAHLQEHHADAIVRNPALLTEHLSLSQQHIPAIQNYLTVSQWALFQGAFEDAEAHVLAAISLCDTAPTDVDVGALEIACYTALGSIRMQSQGFMAAPVKEAFDKVIALAQGQKAYSAANGPAFYGSFTHAMISADMPKSVQFSDMLRTAASALSETEEGQELRLASLNVDTSLRFYAGDFGKASAAFDTLRKVYDVTKHGGMITSYGADTYAAAQMFECVTRAICGDADQIPELIAETDAHQERLNIPVMQPWALIWGAVPLFYAGKIDSALARLRKGLQTAASQSAVFWQVTGAAWLNVMDTSETYDEDGLAAFQSVIKTHETIGANIGLPYFRAHYAIALARHDLIDDAYQASLQSVRENAANGLHCWYPEVLRLHAQVCELRGAIAGAARFRKQAAEIATRQNALLWLLRVRLDQFRAEEIRSAKLRKVLDRLPTAARTPEARIALNLLNPR